MHGSRQPHFHSKGWKRNTSEASRTSGQLADNAIQTKSTTHENHHHRQALSPLEQDKHGDKTGDQNKAFLPYIPGEFASLTRTIGSSILLGNAFDKVPVLPRSRCLQPLGCSGPLPSPSFSPEDGC